MLRSAHCSGPKARQNIRAEDIVEAAHLRVVRKERERGGRAKSREGRNEDERAHRS